MLICKSGGLQIPVAAGGFEAVAGELEGAGLVTMTSGAVVALDDGLAGALEGDGALLVGFTEALADTEAEVLAPGLTVDVFLESPPGAHCV